jgi:phosphoribosylanthranilate isomerase
MDVFIKICGIANPKDLDDVSALRPDAVGFVLWPDSPRAVKPQDLIRWLPASGTHALKIGVFVKPDPEQVVEIARLAGLDAVQLHGVDSLSPYRVAGLRVWKAVYADRLKPSDTAERVDALVADTYSKDCPGGTGKVGNWEAIRSLVQCSEIPVVLAGGLKPENVRSALRVVNPWGVDVSSGVESSPGKKNIDRVREFIQQCRNT